MAYGRRRYYPRRRYYGRRRYYPRRRYYGRRRKGFKSGFRYGGTYASEMRGKKIDWGAQIATDIVFNPEEAGQQTDKPYCLLALNAYDHFFGVYPVDNQNTSNWQKFQAEYPTLKTGRILSVKHKIQLTTNGSSPLEVSSVFLPYTIRNHDGTILKPGMYGAVGGSNIKSQLMQISTSKQRTISQGTYYWNNPMSRSFTAPSSVQDNVDLVGIGGVDGVEGWFLGDFANSDKFKSIDQDPRIFNPTLYILLQNIQLTTGASFKVQIKTNVTFAFQAEQFRLTNTYVPNAGLQYTVSMVSTSNVRAANRQISNINQLQGIYKILAKIARDDDQNVYLDESNGLLIDNTCYSSTMGKYHVKAHIDLQPPPDSTTLIQNQYQANEENIPQTVITEWGDLTYENNPTEIQAINDKYTFPRADTIMVYDSGEVFTYPYGTKIAALSEGYAYVTIDGEYMSKIGYYNNDCLSDEPGSYQGVNDMWNVLSSPQSVPADLGFQFINPTEYLQTIQQAYQETLQSWPFAFQGDGLTQPTMNQFAGCVSVLRATTDGNTISSINYSNWYTTYSTEIRVDDTHTLKTLVDMIEGTPIVIDSSSTSWNQFMYNCQQNIATYGFHIFVIALEQDYQGMEFFRAFNIVLYKEEKVHLQLLYFLQQIMPAMSVMIDHLGSWVTGGNAVSVGLDLTELTYQWNQAIIAVAPVDKVNWKKVWTKVKGGFSKAWKWVKGKALPFVKKVVVPHLPGPVGTVVGAITEGVETVSNVVDIIANAKKKPSSMAGQGTVWAPNIVFKCTPKYAITEQGSNPVPIYEDQYWQDGGETNVITTTTDQWEVQQIRHTCNIKRLREIRGLSYLGTLRNHLLTDPQGDTDDYPYQLQSQLQVEVDVPSQQNYDIGSIQLIASNDVGIVVDEENAVQNNIDTQGLLKYSV